MTTKASVRLRIIAGAGAVLVLAVALVALTVGTLLRRALAADEHAVLSTAVQQVQRELRAGADPAGALADEPIAGHVAILDGTGAVVATTEGDARRARVDQLAIPPAGSGRWASATGRELGLADADYAVLTRTDRYPGGTFTVIAFASLRAAQRAQSHLRDALLLALPVVVVAAGLFLFVVVGRALAPVEQLRAAVEQIQAKDLSQRVPVGRAGDGGDEIARLGSTLNRMLDRLADAAARQQLFAASASHELRSPLSAVRTELEVGLAYPERTDWPSVARDCLIEIGRLEQLARDLRSLTRPHSSTRHAQRIELIELTAAELQHRRSAHRLRLEAAPGGGTELHADPDTVVQVLRNLLDNAERHARTTVSVRVAATEPSAGAPAGVELIVSNDGEPIPEPQHERIFDPFTRLDEARSLDHGGSGLGLAISRRLVEGEGGTLRALASREGASFRAWWPAGDQLDRLTGTVRGPRT